MSKAPVKYLSLNNLKRIWQMISETFARKDYVEYLESRIEALEKNVIKKDV